MNRASIISIIAALLIALWSYAAMSKLVDFEHSRIQMVNQVFSTDISTILVWAVPASELASASLLLFRTTRLWGLYASAFLLFAFSAYIALVLSRTFGRVPCSCGGILEKMSWELHLVFNIAFLLLTLLGVLYELKERRPMGKDNE